MILANSWDPMSYSYGSMCPYTYSTYFSLYYYSQGVGLLALVSGCSGLRALYWFFGFKFICDLRTETYRAKPTDCTTRESHEA